MIKRKKKVWNRKKKKEKRKKRNHDLGNLYKVSRVN